MENDSIFYFSIVSPHKGYIPIQWFNGYSCTILVMPLFTLCCWKTKGVQLNYNFLKIIELVKYGQARCFSNKVRGWENVGNMKGCPVWEKLSNGGQREKIIKVCKKQTLWEGKSQDTDMKASIWIVILIITQSPIVLPWFIHICLKWQIGGTCYFWIWIICHPLITLASL